MLSSTLFTVVKSRHRELQKLETVLILTHALRMKMSNYEYEARVNADYGTGRIHANPGVKMSLDK